MTPYQQFKELDINCSAIGLEQRDTDVTYFCTPMGAAIIGWAGVDGIHYCFVRGFGETVFVVDPTNYSGRYVHPIAGSFEDLLRLLLACGSMDALAQAHGWSEAQFDGFLNENQPSGEQRAVLDTLRDRFSIAPMERPYAYIKELQAAFDYDQIPYPPEYYDPDLNPAALEAQEWKVTYEGGFWSQKGAAGQEIPVGKTFHWGSETWYLPAVYACGEGLVVDLCLEAAPEAVKAFLDKWAPREAEEHLTKEERELLKSEHPLNRALHLKAELNGTLLRSKHRCCVTWIPASCLSENAPPQPEAKQALAHYGLDPERAWSIHRFAVPWAATQEPELRTLRLHLVCAPVSIPGIHFKTPASGEQISFRHPVTGEAHTLTVQETEAQILSKEHFPGDHMEYPNHCTAMTYTLSPDLPDRELSIRDCAESDQPRCREALPGFLGIIGGADGPTAFFLASPSSPKCHAACSSLHFAPTEDVEWRMVFRVKRMDDCTVEAIGPDTQ